MRNNRRRAAEGGAVTSSSRLTTDVNPSIQATRAEHILGGRSVAGAGRAVDFLLSRKLLWPLAVALFAVSQGPVYFSSELKPYAVDVAATVFLLLGGVILTERLQDTRVVVGIGVGGVALMAFSFASIFVLAAAAIVLAVEAARRRGRLSRAHRLVLAVWITGAVGAAFFALERLSTVRSAFQAGPD